MLCDLRFRGKKVVIGLVQTIKAIEMTMIRFHSSKMMQNMKDKTFVRRMMGTAIPINEKKDVLSGETYHAGKDNNSRSMEMIVTTRTIALIIFCII